MRSTTVFLVGGLGNQLHQLSVAVGLARYSQVRLSTSWMGEHRQLESMAAIRASGLELVEDLATHPEVTSLATVDPAEPPSRLLSFPDSAPWMAHAATPVQFMELVKELIEDRPATVTGVTETSTVVHMRLGDYLWPTAARRYGVLAPSYYAQAIEEVGAPGAVLTDDAAAAARLYRRLFHDGSLVMLAPGSTLHDFSVMCAAERFVAANSTLSLWASWYRGVNGMSDRTIAPSTLYRLEPRSGLPGLGVATPTYINPMRLVASAPWVLTRRLSWRGKFW